MPIQHGQAPCPILQAAYCTSCSMNGHFTNECPKRPLQSLFHTKAIPVQVQNQNPKTTVWIGHTQEAYEQYCTSHKIPKAEKIADTFARVKQHCASKGHYLADPPEFDKHATKKKPVPK